MAETIPRPLSLFSVLEEIQCSDYLSLFQENGITDLEDFKFLDKTILKEIGVKAIGDRLLILNKATELKDVSTAEKIAHLTKKIKDLSVTSIQAVNEELVTDKNTVIFILNDGIAKKVNVSGCFNADSIKAKLIKRLTNKNTNPKDYDVFLVDYAKNTLNLLYDVELVTISHSSDRIEKNRLLFVPKDETPTDAAVATSQKIYLKTLSMSYYPGANSANSGNKNGHPGSDGKPLGASQSQYTGKAPKLEHKSSHQFRKVFDQRPAGELISSNLQEYFPDTDMKKLKTTVRNSVRQSYRLSVYGNARGNKRAFANNVGGVILNNTEAVDKALMEDVSDTASVYSRQSMCASLTGDDDLEGYDDLSSIASLSNNVHAPKNWLKGAKIGSGSYGNVYIGMNSETGELMAVKQVEFPKVVIDEAALAATNALGQKPANSGEDHAESNDAAENGNKNNNNNNNNNNKLAVAKSSTNHKMIEALKHEMDLLKDLHHENIVQYYGSSEENSSLNIFLEYVPGGSVSSMLSNYGPFEESLIKNFVRQILVGVSYLHRKNIIHRDIKGANILIDMKGTVKITDFGISRKLSPISRHTLNKRASLQGSVYWMAPEVVKQVTITSKADIWSVGCVIIEMYTGKHPFPEFSQMQALFKIGTNVIPDIPSWAGKDAKSFLMKTFALDFRKRPNSIQLLSHSWIDASKLQF
ncbi:hypothetical protein ACO0QE_003381 [Hanseniaspora vineae]